MTTTHDPTEHLERDARTAALPEGDHGSLTWMNSLNAIFWEAPADRSRFTFISEQADRLLGYPRSAWLADPGFWADHIHPDDRERCVVHALRETSAGRDHDFEYRMIAADGRIVWLRDIVTVVSEDGRPVSLRGVMVDVTKQKDAFFRLCEDEQQYRAVFDSSSDGLFIADPSTGRVFEVNASFSQLFGQTGSDGVFPAADAGSVPELLQPANGAPVRATLLRADGSRFEAEVVCRPFSYRGRPAVLGAIRDVTDQVRMEHRLESRVADRTREIESLLGVARAVASTLELRELVRLVLTELRNVVDYSAASLILVEGDELVVHDLVVDPMRAGKETPQTGARFRISELSAGSCGGDQHPSTIDYPCVQVAASREFWKDIGQDHSVVIDDVLHSDGPIATAYREAMGHLLHTPAFAFIRTWMAVPLIVKGDTIGYFGVASDEPYYFTPKHERLAKAFADHASVAFENARLYEQAHALAALEERQRLARDLHDSVAQAMYGVALGARTARKYLKHDVEAIEPVDYVVSLAAAGLAEMRALIFDLHPGAVAEEGLVNAIKRQVNAVEARHGLTVNWTAHEPDVEVRLKEAAYSVIREALHNIVKHAQASTVTITVEASPTRLEFSVRDDGIGFDPTASSPGHLGLRSMRERVERLGGTVRVVSSPGSGTLVSGSLPCPAS